MGISVLTVTHGRRESLDRFLRSLVQAHEFNTLDVVILINGIDHASEEILTTYCNNFRNIRTIQCHSNKRGKARNLLVQNAKEDIVYFLDDDIIVAKNTFLVLWQKCAEYIDCDILGGPNLTPPGSTLFQKAQGEILGTLFGSWHISSRYRQVGIDRITDDSGLILCNLAIRKNVFKRHNISFNESLLCAEENLLLQKLHFMGHTSLYTPDLVVYHERRKSCVSLCQQIFTYGRGRAQLFMHEPRSSSFIHFVPSLFVGYLMSLPFVTVPLYYVPLILYCIVWLISSLYVAIRNKSFKMMLFALLLYPTVHCAYGIGILFELFMVNIIFSKDRLVREDTQVYMTQNTV